MGVCCCLQICNSVVNMLVMGLVHTWAKFDGHIYNGYPIIMQKCLPFIMYYEVWCTLQSVMNMLVMG